MIESVIPHQTNRMVVCTIGDTLEFKDVARFKEQCDALVETGFIFFVLDFSSTRFMDSTGFGSLMRLHKMLAPYGGRVVMVNPVGAVQALVSLTKCDRVFGNYTTVQEAMDTWV